MAAASPLRFPLKRRASIMCGTFAQEEPYEPFAEVARLRTLIAMREGELEMWKKAASDQARTVTQQAIMLSELRSDLEKEKSWRNERTLVLTEEEAPPVAVVAPSPPLTRQRKRLRESLDKL